MRVHKANARERERMTTDEKLSTRKKAEKLKIAYEFLYFNNKNFMHSVYR